MNRTMNWRTLLLALILLSPVAHGRELWLLGGMDSGGGTGLPFRLEKAKEITLQILATVSAGDLNASDPRVARFYADHRAQLIVEAASSEIEIVPAAEVYILVDGVRLPRHMVTGLTTQAAVRVADTLSTTDPLELAFNLIHEFGHHLGVSQTEDAFLDLMAKTVVNRAIELNPALRIHTQPCRTPDELLAMLIGDWRGTATNPWTGRSDIEFQIFPDGRYNTVTLKHDPNAFYPSTPLYYDGTEGPHPRRQLRVLDACTTNATGELDLVHRVGTLSVLKMRSIRVSPDGGSLNFEIFRVIEGREYGPIVFELERQKP